MTKRLKFLKDKYFWLTALITFLVVLPYFVWSKIKFGSFLIFLSGSREVSELIQGGDVGRSIGWHVLNLIPTFSKTIFFIFFIIGILTLYKLIVGFDLITRNKQKELYPDLFILLFLIINLSFFIFIQRSAEDRWLIPISISLFLITAKGFSLIYDHLKKLNKHLALIAILILLGIGAYSHLSQTDEIIKIKKDTYQEVKAAALWIQENSDDSDVILTASGPQTAYYSERKIIGYGDKEVILQRISEYKPKYMIISAFEGHPDWVYSYPEENNLKPVQVYFADAERTKPLLVIYELISE